MIGEPPGDTLAFCTYLDSHYLARGVALHASLARVVERFTLHVLCLDDDALRLLSQLGLANAIPVPLAQLEAADPELAQVKQGRPLLEYYLTCTPALTRHLLAQHGELQVLTYVDADLYFFSDPSALLAGRQGRSISITPHRFPEERAELASRGRYNVGWVSFARTPQALACLEEWRTRCLESCSHAPERGVYGDQKYLDDWPLRYDGVAELRDAGANLAPWNLARHEVREHQGRVLVDGAPLLFYHFHALRAAAGSWLYDAQLSEYGARMSSAVRSRVYAPYLRALLEAERALRRFGYRLGPLPRGLRHAEGGKRARTLPTGRGLLRRMRKLSAGDYLWAGTR